MSAPGLPYAIGDDGSRQPVPWPAWAAYYIVARDSFLSGWGPKGEATESWIAVACRSLTESVRVRRNATDRGELRELHRVVADAVHTGLLWKPRGLVPVGALVALMTPETSPRWFEPGRPFR